MKIRVKIIAMLAEKNMTRAKLADDIGVGRSTLYNALSGFTTTINATRLLVRAYNFLDKKE